ncbi:TPA: hypothetical protein ACYU6U_002834 [Klebsiella pneumoniae]|jgi:DNA-binding XRE family transcriptional regulator|uniref:hypothetical protein n=1 Tax=Klebsiella pneumoniae complex TaxID=3390273 RepID=UPI000C7B4CD6|nr:hypothetical protein [Klebsiella pneumoniae]PLD47539.1 hypothetical protein B6I55_07035 [Klebsiella pneumoniae]
MAYVDYDYHSAGYARASYVENDNVTGWSHIGFFKSMLLFAAVTLSCNSDATSPIDHLSIECQINKGIQSNDATFASEEDDGSKSQIHALSSELQKKFGFKKAQWASILNVERKTLYNWESNPNSTPHIKVWHNLKTLDKFASEIDIGHAPYISKMTFGKGRKQEFTQAFTTQPLSFESMISVYEKYYTEIDGFYKRQLLS